MILVADIGATFTRFAIFDGKKIQSTTKKETAALIACGGIYSELESLANENPKAKSIGISVAGPVDGDSAVMTNGSGKTRFSVKDFESLGLPVFLINDASAAVFAEANHYKSSDIVFITISSGIGVGVVQNGKIVKFSDTKEELGHLPVSFPINEKCGCGELNHWEAYCSGLNLTRFFRDWSGGTFSDDPAELFWRPKVAMRRSKSLSRKSGVA